MAQRTIRQVVTPAPRRPISEGMANRILIEPGNWAGYDPFRVLVEDWMREPGGFPDHPHRGIETVTTVSCTTQIIAAIAASWRRTTCQLMRRRPFRALAAV